MSVLAYNMSPYNQDLAESDYTRPVSGLQKGKLMSMSQKDLNLSEVPEVDQQNRQGRKSKHDYKTRNRFKYPKIFF